MRCDDDCSVMMMLMMMTTCRPLLFRRGVPPQPEVDDVLLGSAPQVGVQQDVAVPAVEVPVLSLCII
jgi:hypothetical protein